jgi:hypothetical protein
MRGDDEERLSRAARNELADAPHETDLVRALPPPDELAVFEVGADGVPMLDEVPAALSRAQVEAQKRRNEVQWLMAMGCPLAEIARRLGASPRLIAGDAMAIRSHNNARFETIKASDVMGQVDAAYGRLLERTMSVADSAGDDPGLELKALAEARKTMAAKIAAMKQLGVVREAPKPPAAPQEHVHRFEIPPEVKQIAVMAALAPALKTQLTEPQPDRDAPPKVEAPVLDVEPEAKEP